MIMIYSIMSVNLSLFECFKKNVHFYIDDIINVQWIIHILYVHMYVLHNIRIYTNTQKQFLLLHSFIHFS